MGTQAAHTPPASPYAPLPASVIANTTVPEPPLPAKADVVEAVVNLETALDTFSDDVNTQVPYAEDWASVQSLYQTLSDMMARFESVNPSSSF